ncbi:hypothetical protein TNCV_3597681 [Trichonephila clavipes]|nr:hypothetical protein TNCV_3597681 [Trichonephila clavipes]
MYVVFPVVTLSLGKIELNKKPFLSMKYGFHENYQIGDNITLMEKCEGNGYGLGPIENSRDRPISMRLCKRSLRERSSQLSSESTFWVDWDKTK